jgi:nicotinamidase-related amidase
MLTRETALLVMDVQVGTVAGHPREGLLDAVGRAIAAARTADVPVIYVQALFRAGYPEVSPSSRVYSGLAAAGRLRPDDPGAAIHPDVAPEPGDVVVTKRRTSAFSGSDLQVVLRAQRIGHLVLAGVRTSGVVAATLREAADLDYDLTVLSDCCADVDGELHDMLMERLFTRYADVMTADEWAAQVSAAG